MHKNTENEVLLYLLDESYHHLPPLCVLQVAVSYGSKAQVSSEKPLKITRSYLILSKTLGNYMTNAFLRTLSNVMPKLFLSLLFRALADAKSLKVQSGVETSARVSATEVLRYILGTENNLENLSQDSFP